MRFIESIEINPVVFPVSKPFSNHVRQIKKINGLVIEMETIAGVKGHSLMYGLAELNFKNIIEDMKKSFIDILLNNKKIIDSESLKKYWDKIWEFHDSCRISYEKRYALASFDILIWDVFTKDRKVSLHEYFGGAQRRIKVYGTTGWLSFNEKELIKECQRYAMQGINAFKIRIGHEKDLQRIKAVRSAMGENFNIMLDANQRYTPEEAIYLSEKLAKFNILWLEEPTDYSFKSLKHLKSGKIPIAVGENIADIKIFHTICKFGLANYLQPDIPRCGGVSGFIKVLKLSQEYELPICNHFMYELSVSLISSTMFGYMLEFDNFLPPEMLTKDFTVKDGHANMPTGPGTGVEMTEESLKKTRISCFSYW